MRLNASPEHMFGCWASAGYPYYAGAGEYSQQVDLTQVSLAPDEELWLEAEDIRETASLYVNDMEVGIRLWPPYHWDITPYVEQGSNWITIRDQYAGELIWKDCIAFRDEWKGEAGASNFV